MGEDDEQLLAKFSRITRAARISRIQSGGYVQQQKMEVSTSTIPEPHDYG